MLLIGGQGLDGAVERLGCLTRHVGHDARALPVGSRDRVADAGFWQHGAHMAADAHGGDVIGRPRGRLPDKPRPSPTLDVVAERFAR
jgi:hypothetical protein